MRVKPGSEPICVRGGSQYGKLRFNFETGQATWEAHPEELINLHMADKASCKKMEVYEEWVQDQKNLIEELKIAVAKEEEKKKKYAQKNENERLKENQRLTKRLAELTKNVAEMKAKKMKSK